MIRQDVYRPRIMAAWAALLAVLLGGRPGGACTLWGAAGPAVAGGGILVAKNRDWAPDQLQELVVWRPIQGHPMVALKAVGGSEPGIKAGVNDLGLAIVSASADQVPIAERPS